MKKNFSLRAVFALLVALWLSLSMRVQAQSFSALLRLPKTQRDLEGGFACKLAFGAGDAYIQTGSITFRIASDL
jgi:hypothetical protein